MQQIYTGHGDILDEATTDEAERYDANQQLYEYSKNQAAKEAQVLSIEHGTNGVGAFYADAASLHLISPIVEGKNNIYSENSMGQLYDVNRESSNNKSQYADYLCKEQAENFSIALNKLSKDPELIRK